jgi:hypothetical protein
MADVEKLHFKIGLTGIYWGKRPEYTVLVNDREIVRKQVETASEELFYEEFDVDVEEGPATLKIRLENKEDSDVKKDNYEDPENFNIIGDLQLSIKSVEIDEIDLANMIYTKTEFVGDDTGRPVLDRCVDLGWNGTWTLPFESPFYIWLLENI